MKSYVNRLNSLLNLTITKRKKINFTISVVHTSKKLFFCRLTTSYVSHAYVKHSRKARKHIESLREFLDRVGSQK